MEIWNLANLLGDRRVIPSPPTGKTPKLADEDETPPYLAGRDNAATWTVFLAYRCNGAAQIDKASACAWYSVLMATHVNQATDLDAANVQSVCGTLSPVQALLAKAKAEEIGAQIATLTD